MVGEGCVRLLLGWLSVCTGEVRVGNMDRALVMVVVVFDGMVVGGSLGWLEIVEVMGPWEERGVAVGLVTARTGSENAW